MMTPVEHPGTHRFGILFVCTGNRFRSPVAEVLARRLLDEKFGPVHAARFDVSSAGTQAVPGASIHPLTRAELVGLGLDDDESFPDSTPLSVGAIRSADLVLTAERAHRSTVVQMAPTALGKTFCLREFARLVASVECAGMPSEPVALARAAVVAARDNRGLIPPVVPSEDDIADPMGLNQAAHHAAARVISSALAQILGVPSPVVAESRRRWSRPIRRRTASPAAPSDRESTLDPATVPLSTAPAVEHDPQPQPSDAVLPGDQPREDVAVRSGEPQPTTPVRQDPARFPDPHPDESSPPAVTRSWRLAPYPEPATGASTKGAAEARSLEGVQVTGDAPPVAAVNPHTVPTVMRTSLGLWIASFLAGLVGMALSFTNLPELRAGLEEIAQQRQPDVEAGVIEDAVSILLYGALGGIVFLISIQVFLAVLMGKRRNWARVLLTVVAVLSLPVLLLTRDIVNPQAGWTLVLEAFLMLAALVTMFLPAANSWFRQQR